MHAGRALRARLVSGMAIGALARGEKSARSRTILRIAVLALFVTCAALTFCYLRYFPTFVEGRPRAVPFAGCASAVFFVLGMSPALWLAWIAALVAGDRVILYPFEAHAAVLVTLVVVTLAVWPPPPTSSPGDFFDDLVKAALVGVAGIEAVIVLIGRIRAMRSDRPRLPFVFAWLTAALLGGWATGILIWSMMLPSRVIAAAEAAAAERPYCIRMDGRTASRAGDLTGFAMRVPDHYGWIWDFHALLVIGEGETRYMNWSYHSGRFEPVSDRARTGLHLDTYARCAPAAHFARDW